jgi:Asp-tRNA(Asn)/Glu-tRNA(Gln) amidotransferase A subunit family amidase
MAQIGAVRNPADPTRFPGGSSGGTAAAIAADIVPGGLRADTAGSVRVPAALCGVVGFRPTTWRVDQRGAVPAVPTFDVIGPMARNMADVAVLSSVMIQNRVSTRRDSIGLRIGVARPQTENTSEGVAAAFDAA